MAPHQRLQQSVSLAVVSERLTDMLQCFPAAAIGGVQWVTLVRKYEEKYCTKLDLDALGYDSALTAASSLLWDVVRIVENEDADNPILVIEDSIALTPRPAFLATWPSLYAALVEIVRDNGAGSNTNASNSRAILLSQVKPLLQRHWHKNFDDCGLTYYTEEGSVVKLKKMKHLFNALFRWRADRLASRASMRIPASGSSGIEVAIAIDLDILPSETRNDLLVRCFIPSDTPMSVVVEDAIDGTEVINKAHFAMALPLDALGTSDSDDSIGDSISVAESNSAMLDEIERLRAENTMLRYQKEVACMGNMCVAPIKFQHIGPMEDLFDNPFEPPPAMWTPSSVSTRAGSGIHSGMATPLTDASLSGSCTPMPVMENSKGMTLMPFWFPVALGDRVQIPSGIVQQACTVFNQQTSIPSFYSQQMR